MTPRTAKRTSWSLKRRMVRRPRRQAARLDNGWIGVLDLNSPDARREARHLGLHIAHFTAIATVLVSQLFESLEVEPLGAEFN